MLSRHGISIDTMTTETREAPMAGGMLFEATAVLQAPAGTSLPELRVLLDALADELMVQITLSEP